MASILQFAAAEHGEPRASKILQGPRGQVVIFPGVRIERHRDADEQPVETPPKRARARKK